MFLFSPTDVTSRITGAIRDASRMTGAGFDFLLRTAMRESAMNPAAKAATSSAAGLFQFIESTWLSMVKEEGAKHGLGAYSDQIVKGSSGRYQVPDAAARKEILALRYDPEAASAMAGELTERNRESLEGALGRAPSEGELYIAHFLGARDASALIGLAANEPDSGVVDRFPRQAAANRSIFYEGGRPRSAVEVYRQLVSKHEGAASSPAPSALALAGGTPATPPAEDAPVAPVVPSPLGGRFAWAHRATMPVFHGLFTGEAGRAPSSVVKAAWASFSPPASPSPSERFAAIVGSERGAIDILPRPRDRSESVPASPGAASGAPLNLLPYRNVVPASAGGTRV